MSAMAMEMLDIQCSHRASTGWRWRPCWTQGRRAGEQVPAAAVRRPV